MPPEHLRCGKDRDLRQVFHIHRDCRHSGRRFLFPPSPFRNARRRAEWRRFRSRIDWMRLAGRHLGEALARPWHAVPTLMISFGHPSYLYDAPRVPTEVNAYSTLESVQQAVVDALLGNLPWNRNSPVGPFCGLEDARY